MQKCFFYGVNLGTFLFNEQFFRIKSETGKQNMCSGVIYFDGCLFEFWAKKTKWSETKEKMQSKQCGTKQFYFILHFIKYK